VMFLVCMLDPSQPPCIPLSVWCSRALVLFSHRCTWMYESKTRMFVSQGHSVGWVWNAFVAELWLCVIRGKACPDVNSSSVCPMRVFRSINSFCPQSAACLHIQHRLDRRARPRWFSIDIHTHQCWLEREISTFTWVSDRNNRFEQ